MKNLHLVNFKIMKMIASVLLLFIATIGINSCDNDDSASSNTFTVNMVDGSTNKPIPNIQGAFWSPLFRHDNAFQTSNRGSSALLNGGQIKINMAESTEKIRYIELFGPLSAELDPNSAFSQKYYTQGNRYFSPADGLEQTQVYYTKATIKCIVNVTKPENAGKEFNISLTEPADQRVSIKQGFNLVYTIKALVVGSQYVYINAIGNYKNQMRWGVNNITRPDNPIEIFCNESETKELIINL